MNRAPRKRATRTSPPVTFEETGSAVERVSEALLESALRDSEERYRSIVTAMSEGVVLQDAAGRIIECNASAERMLGLSREEMLGRTSLDPRWQATDAAGGPMAARTIRSSSPWRRASRSAMS